MTCRSSIRRLRSLRACGIALALACVVSAQSAPTGRITGRVLDALGEGITAARIQLEATIDGKTVAQRTVSDADGMYVLTEAPLSTDTGFVLVSAEATGHCKSTTGVRMTREMPNAYTVLRLWDAGTIDLRVVDEDGRPVAGATVVAHPEDFAPSDDDVDRKGLTGADGRFRLEGVPVGIVDVGAWSTGTRPAHRTIELSDRATVEIGLERHAQITLRVRVDGLPEGREAQVRIQPPDGEAALLGLEQARPTDHGVLALDALPDLDYRIHASSAGLTSDSPQWQLEAVGDPDEIRIALTPIPVMRVRGSLHDQKGAPLADVTVRCHPGGSVCTAITDAAGAFTLDLHIEAGQKASFVLRDDRFLLLGKPHTWVAPDFQLPAMVELRVIQAGREYSLTGVRTTTVSGKVVGPDGSPVRGRMVYLGFLRTNPGLPVQPWEQAATADDGSFTFRSAIAAPCKQCVALDPNARIATEPFEVTEGRIVTGLVLTAPVPGVIEGRIRDASGRSQPGLRVSAQGCDPASGNSLPVGSEVEVRTDREGRYRFIDLEPGTYAVLVFRTGHKLECRTDAFDVGAGASVTHDFQLAQ